MALQTDSPAEEPVEQEKPKLTLEVKVVEPSPCQRHVTVSVGREDIERYFEDAFNEFQPSAEVPGFRAGKAPRKLVESRFREQMSSQVKGSLLMDSVSQASDECNFSAISEPDFDFEAIDLPDSGPMKFEFDIEVRPEFDLPEWKGLKLERVAYEYSDEEVDGHLRELLARYARLTTKDRAAAAGDRVTIRIQFKQGDTILSEAKETTVAIRPKLSFGDGNIDGFDDLMIGARAGDRREARLTISEEAENEELRGQEVVADIEVAAVKQVDLPEMTPGFLDRIGGFDDEEDLREAVRSELERQLTYHQQRQIRQQITGVLTESATWELPPDLLKRQGRRELERAVLELRTSGFSDDVIRTHQNQLRQNSQASTERALKEHFILERIAEDQEIDAEPGDFDAEVRLIASQSMEAPRRVRARLEKKGQMDSLRNQIIERKVIDVITSEAKFTDTPFEPAKDETVAIDHTICGQRDEADIPEAKYGGDAQELRGVAERD
jgi:trigger factor